MKQGGLSHRVTDEVHCEGEGEKYASSACDRFVAELAQTTVGLSRSMVHSIKPSASRAFTHRIEVDDETSIRSVTSCTVGRTPMIQMHIAQAKYPSQVRPKTPMEGAPTSAFDRVKPNGLSKTVQLISTSQRSEYLCLSRSSGCLCGRRANPNCPNAKRNRVIYAW
jgi:hypothetical protein